jgi:hypothetical protein
MAYEPVRWPYLRLDSRLIDSDTGRVADVEEAAALLVSHRASTPLRSAEGRRIWFRGTKAVTENADGSLSIGDEALPVPGFPCGFGVQFSRRGVFDAIRGRYFETKAPFVRVRPGRWLAKQRMGDGPMMLLDPETGEWSDALGIDEEDWVASVHDDGRIFVFRVGGALALVNPESGEREVVRDSDGIVVEPESFRDASRFGRCASRTPGGSRLFMLDGVPARYDAESSRLVCAKVRMHEPMLLIGCADDDAVFVLVGERRIERLELGTPTRTVLYSED